MDQPSPGRRYLPALAAILILYAALAATAFVEFSSSPFAHVPMIDEESYVGWAKEILAAGRHGVFYQDPLYPYFLAAVFGIFGKSFAAARIIQVGIGAVGLLLAAGAARRVAGDRAGLAAALLVALYAGTYYYSLLLLKAELEFALGALACYAGVRVAEDADKHLRWLALGTALGLLALTRGNALGLAPLAIVWAIATGRERTWRQRLGRALATAAGVALIITPVAARNYAVSGDLVLTTSQAGANFYIGNNADANGRYRAPAFVRAHPRFESEDFQREAERRTGRDLTPSQVSRFWLCEGLKWIASHPGRALVLTVHKARLLVSQYEIPDNHSFYLIREVFAPVLWAAFVGYGILWGPALAGILLALRRGRRADFPAVFIIGYSATIVPFFIVSRYRMALVAPLALFAAVFVEHALETLARKNWRELALPGALAAFVIALGFWPTPESRSPRAEEYYLLADAYEEAGRPADALAWYERALAGHPDYTAAQQGWIEAVGRLEGDDLAALADRAASSRLSVPQLLALGRRLREAQDWERAERVYELAAQLDPGSYEAHAFLGFAYSQLPNRRDLDRAVRHYQAALDLRPNDAPVMLRLARCLVEQGDDASARKLYDEVLRLDPDNADARAGLEQLDKPPGLPP